MLYRIDLERTDGMPLGAVSDILGPCLIRQWRVARALAIETANARQCVATISRISGAGSMRAMARAAAGSNTIERI